MRRFGGDPGVVGRAVRTDEGSALVAGVMPGSFRPLGTEEYWEPFRFTQDSLKNWGRFAVGWARLKPGVSVEAAQREMSLIARRLERVRPDFDAGWDVAGGPDRGGRLGKRPAAPSRARRRRRPPFPARLRQCREPPARQSAGAGEGDRDPDGAGRFRRPYRPPVDRRGASARLRGMRRGAGGGRFRDSMPSRRPRPASSRGSRKPPSPGVRLPSPRRSPPPSGSASGSCPRRGAGSAVSPPRFREETARPPEDARRSGRDRSPRRRSRSRSSCSTGAGLVVRSLERSAGSSRASIPPMS